ncbi:MAG: GNAT family N-acetyltransferase [Methanoregula sp.]|nr:GNAT family N-acetyltransferase [Methanoregula sp.]
MAGNTGRSGNGIHVPDLRSSLMGQPACVPLTESDVESAARLYTEVFLADEPTSHRHALDPALFLPYARFYVRSLVRKDLSFLSRHETTNELAGFIFCFDLTDDPENEGAVMSEFIAHFKEAVVMIHELEDRHLNREDIMAGSVLHIFQIGVSRQYRETGIARAMIRRVLAHARECGFRQVIADCTGPASKRVFEQCDFSEMGFSTYEAFSMDGIRFFAGLDGGISLMVKNI